MLPCVRPVMVGAAEVNPAEGVSKDAALAHPDTVFLLGLSLSQDPFIYALGIRIVWLQPSDSNIIPHGSNSGLFSPLGLSRFSSFAELFQTDSIEARLTRNQKAVL